MTFTVEMIHGRPSRLEINEHGRIFLGGKDDDFGTYAVGRNRWEENLSIGKKYGWIPMGTILSSRETAVDEVRSDYEPASWNQEGIYKMFTAADAMSLSNALQAYLDDKFGGENISINPNEGTKSSTDRNAQAEYNWVMQFILFLRKGDFIFVWDD